MKIAIPKEIAPGETRVAAVPETVKRFKQAGLDVLVQAGAGAGAMIDDEEYAAAAAEIVPDAAELYGQADVVLKVNAPLTDSPTPAGEIGLLRSGTILIAPLAPARNGELIRGLAEAGVTSFALNLLPRITRAQSMDVLSSMATLAGYKAVLLAADELAKILPMMMTAAGTIRPAAALVIGAGVAGLQAIATAKRLGAIVTGVDVRPAVKEQVESLAAKFVSLEVHHEAQTAGGYAADLGEEFYRQEQEILAPHVKAADLVVTTALIPNRRAPLLITEPMVQQMRRGSVIVDLAAGAGGNCTLTKPDERVEHGGVIVLGPTNLPASLPVPASLMFARNVAAFLKELIAEGQARIDTDNEVLRETLVTRQGRIVNEAVRKALEGGGES